MSTARWMGRKPALSPEQIREVRRIADARASLPSDRELAEEFGVRLSTLRAYRRGLIPKRYQRSGE